VSKKTAKKNARKLVFPEGEDGDGFFNIVWTGFCVAFPDMAKGFEQLKLCNRIGEKLQDISEEQPGQERAIAPDRTLFVRELLLEKTEWEKLKSMVKSDKVPWTHRVGPMVEETIEWLDACDEVEAELKEKQGEHDGD